MHFRKADRVHSLARFVLMLFLFVALAGCASSHSKKPGPDLAPAPLPQYKEGTTYVYSKGNWERVVAVEPGAVTWENHRGTVSTGAPDFTYKRTTWKSRSRQGAREFFPRDEILATPPISLWPLRVGNVAAHNERGVWSEKGGPEKTYRATWSCKVSGSEHVSVMAGEFDTYKIDCERKSGRRTWELRTWYYAPKVGHFVLSTRRYTYDRSSRRRELLAIIPPIERFSTAKRNHMEQKFQKTLENNRSGRAYTWSSNGLYVQIMPVDTFKIGNGTYCRRYVQQISMPNDKGTFYGMACRESNGSWVIPRQK